ncbi:MAG: ATP-binding protein [Ignavibacteriae bacterium]|nr:ATP-binding protein [Ignavibacteriota bacterium]
MRYLKTEIERLLAEEQKMCFVAGPRQVGKTTLAQHLLGLVKGHSAYFNWDIDSDRKSILKSPETFWLGGAPVGGRRMRLALDEIHKFPRWKRFLKGLYDSHKNDLEILVTGSGRLDVYQRGGDSLFGRYQLYHLFPFTLGEMLAPESGVPSPQEFWERAMEGGHSRHSETLLQDLETLTGFPEPLFSGSEMRLRRWRRSHETLVLREDLRDLTRIRELGLVEALVTLLPERVGSPLSINALREDLNVRFETVQNWLGALSRLFFVFALRPYAGRLARTFRREEKVYLYDFSTIPDPGPRFENLVALHLLKLCHAWTEYGHGDFSLSYVRDREKREVDFLVTEGGKPYALFETKVAAEDVDPSLKYFADRLKPRYSVQVVRKPKRFTTAVLSNGILVTPASHMLALM